MNIDYCRVYFSVANATADLLLLGAWSSAVDLVKGEPIPVCWHPRHTILGLIYLSTQTYYFARDDRVYKAFMERFERHKGSFRGRLSRRLGWQLRVLAKVLEGRNTTYRVSILLDLTLC
jgi:hypothetical protein